EEQTGPGADRFGGARRLTVLAGEFQRRRVHSGSGAARIQHFELAAQAVIGGAAAVLDIVGAGPECAGMIVADVGVAGTVDVGPGGHVPIRPDGLAVSIGGQAVGHLLCQIENVADMRATPGEDFAVGVPAAGVGGLDRRGLAASFENCRGEFGVAGLRVRNFQRRNGRGKQPAHRDVHPSLHHASPAISLRAPGYLRPEPTMLTAGAGSERASSISPVAPGIASTTSMPRVSKILARPAGKVVSVTKVWIWLIWAMRTGALRRNFVESATSITLRALAMMAWAACTSR